MIEGIKTTFTSFLNSGLNEPQKGAVLQKDGALLVIAGAGSGKTRVITSRITNLILHENVEPRSIVALTFTNKAAGEMKERIVRTLGTHYKLPFIGTFHSYCLLLLRSNPQLLPFTQFSILDSDDQSQMLKKIIKRNALAKYVSASQVSYTISNMKNKAFGPVSSDDTWTNPVFKEIYLTYEAEKAQAHAFDFDDLILQVLLLFKNNKDFAVNFQRRIRHVLVDEYQDTSHVQHQLLKYMALNDDNKFALDSVCAVGDEDQSIYSWRGATVTNMLKFKSDFAPVTTIKIEQNYRSVKPILDAANGLIDHNKLRNPKNLWSDKTASNRILVATCRSGEQEADTIAQCIKSMPDTKQRHDVAILYRTHFQSRTIEEALIHHAIPYRIIGGIRFYERKEVKDLLAHLRLIVNPFDKISLMRVINCPNRGLGEKFEEQLLHEWSINPFLNFQQLLTHMLNTPDMGITPLKRSAVLEFLSFFQDLTSNDKPTRLIDHIILRTEYLSYLRNEYDPKEADTKIENVKEFVQSIANFEQKHTDNTNTGQNQSSHHDINPDDPFAASGILESFLHEVALLQEKANEQNNLDQVQMMTLHAAKGLEFDTVMITGLEEGLLPNSKSLNTTDELEEERRLFYVGITRAKEFLLILNAGYRSSYGQITDQAPSRFLSEIPKKLIQSLDVEKLHGSQVRSHLAQWQGGLVTTNMVTFGSAPTDTIKEKTSVKTSKTSYFRTNKTQTNKTYASSSGTSSGFSTSSSVGNSLGGFKKNDLVRHQSFGSGIIMKVEKADGDNFYITALFKTGQKKVLSSFLEKQ